MATIRWAGQLQRVTGVRIPKRVFQNRSDGRRPKVKPEKRQLNNFEEDSITLDVRRCSQVAEDTRKWRVVKEAQALNELYR